jgi:hypothetical protein
MSIKDRFDEAMRSQKVRRYRKAANVAIRPAVPGEVVETWIDGQRETVNTAKAGDYVVRGVKGEQYVITASVLESRYGPAQTEATAEGYRQYAATGTCYAFRHDGEPFRFVASWGEEMIVNPGDYIGTTDLGSDHFYRIEQDTFAATYVEA